jgi:hypothetical protein
MSTVTKPVQEQEGTQDTRIRSDWKSLVEKVSYKAIVNNIPFLAFLAFLCVLYINNSQRAIAIQNEMNKQQNVLKELRWKYMDVSKQLMNNEMETEVIRKAAILGLKPLAYPAYSIQVDTISR